MIRNFFLIVVLGLLLSSCSFEINPKYANYSPKKKQRVTLRNFSEQTLTQLDASKVYLITPQQIQTIVQAENFDTLKIYYGKIDCGTARNYLKTTASDLNPHNLFLFGGTDDWAWIRFIEYNKYPAGFYKFVLNDSVSYNANATKSLAAVYQYYNLPFDSLTNYKLVLTFNKSKELIKVEK